MVLLSSMLYLTNMLCAFVSCQWKWAPTDSYIDGDSLRGRSGRKLSANVTSHPVVVTASGSVQGYSMGTTSGRRVFAFEGIPYAEPPIGNLRFRAPVPKAPWLGTLRTMSGTTNCLQLNPMNLGRVLGNEDCLYLNIYSPGLPDNLDKPNYPVVIFLHGGSYYFGGGSEYGPAYLLNKDIILVTISFRQGVLGYLSTGDKESPGNYGLKDQALAMKWLHENIDKFGGDPARVTLMGQSSGGCMVHMHLIANKTTHYFQNAASLSGTAFNHWSWQSREVARSRAVKLAKLFFCPTENTKEMMACIRQINSAFIVANVLNLYELIPLPMILFAPTIEDANDPGSYLTETPEEAYRRGTVARKPWIVSAVTQEGVMSLYYIVLTRYSMVED
ncbi:unnamed protein product [Allacma fusca]|uniref:Carboxylic ester hydrolase n=1 Tax=Allacma fusca TaxID=39272 RepID=A0A8J2JD09_9HEXA|nr:unnamed protein product [Allacma fusca]